MSMGKAFERLIIPHLATFIDSFVRQQILKAAAFLRLNHCVAQPVVIILPSSSFSLLGSKPRVLRVSVSCSLRLNSQRGVPSFQTLP
jgi:hypothetical protein